MLEKLEQDLERQSDSNSPNSSKAQKVGPKDILVKDAAVKINIEGLIVEIVETLKFRPPRGPTRKAKVNIVQPGKLDAFKQSSAIALQTELAPDSDPSEEEK